MVSRYIKNIFKDTELDEKLVCAKFGHASQCGAIAGKTQTQLLDYYQLDIILAVGYRTNSKQAIQFRKWATAILKQHIAKGYSLNVTRLQKNKQLTLLIAESHPYDKNMLDYCGIH